MPFCGQYLQKYGKTFLIGGNSWEASLGREIGGGFSPKFISRLVPKKDKDLLYPGLGGEELEDQIFGDSRIKFFVTQESNFFVSQGSRIKFFYAHFTPHFSYFVFKIFIMLEILNIFFTNFIANGNFRPKFRLLLY